MSELKKREANPEKASMLFEDSEIEAVFRMADLMQVGSITVDQAKQALGSLVFVVLQSQRSVEFRLLWLRECQVDCRVVLSKVGHWKTPSGEHAGAAGGCGGVDVHGRPCRPRDVPREGDLCLRVDAHRQRRGFIVSHGGDARFEGTVSDFFADIESGHGRHLSDRGLCESAGYKKRRGGS